MGGYGCVLATSCDDDEGIDSDLNQASTLASSKSMDGFTRTPADMRP